MALGSQGSAFPRPKQSPTIETLRRQAQPRTSQALFAPRRTLNLNQGAKQHQIYNPTPQPLQPPNSYAVIPTETQSRTTNPEGACSVLSKDRAGAMPGRMEVTGCEQRSEDVRLAGLLRLEHVLLQGFAQCYCMWVLSLYGLSWLGCCTFVLEGILCTLASTSLRGAAHYCSGPKGLKGAMSFLLIIVCRGASCLVTAL